MNPRRRKNPRPRADQEGLTLIELTVAMVVVLIGALGTLTTMVSSASLEEELQERTVALEAVREVIEVVRTHDASSLTDFAAHWSDPNNQVFSVPNLRAPSAMPVQIVNVAQANGAVGSIAVDTTDPEFVKVDVTLDWGSRRGDRSVTLSAIMTEVEQ